MKQPSFMIDHLRHERPDRPQSYYRHGLFALTNSLRLLLAGFAGVVHAIFPWWFKFYSAEQVVRTFAKVANSGRHDDLLERYGLQQHKTNADADTP